MFEIDSKVVLGLLAIVTTIGVAYAANWWRNKKRVAYEIVSSFRLFPVHGKLPAEFQVLYGGKPVEDVSVVVLDIENTGNQAVLKTDFDENLRIEFGNESKILSAQVLATFPPELCPKLVFDDNSIVVTPTLLNVRDAFRIKILLTGNRRDFKISARIVGVAQLSSTPNRSRPPMTFFALTVGIAIFLSACFYYSASLHFKEMEEGIRAMKAGLPPPPEDNTGRWIVTFGLVVSLLAALITVLWSVRKNRPTFRKRL